MTDNQTPAAIAVAHVKAQATGDIDTIAGYTADDIVFEDPMKRKTGAEAFLAEISDFAKIVTGVKIITVLGDDHQALIMYEMTTVPFGTMRAAEHLTIRDGKIQADTLVFDTHEVRKTLAEQTSRS